MTKEQFDKHLHVLQDLEIQVREAGQKEYAHDIQNVFRNFEEIGRDLDIPREEVLWIFLRKHLDGILAYINGHRSQRESIHGRIKDARMFLALLDGMIEDEKSSSFKEGE